MLYPELSTLYLVGDPKDNHKILYRELKEQINTHKHSNTPKVSSTYRPQVHPQVHTGIHPRIHTSTHPVVTLSKRMGNEGVHSLASPAVSRRCTRRCPHGGTQRSQQLRCRFTNISKNFNRVLQRYNQRYTKGYSKGITYLYIHTHTRKKSPIGNPLKETLWG